MLGSAKPKTALFWTKNPPVCGKWNPRTDPWHFWGGSPELGGSRGCRGRQKSAPDPKLAAGAGPSRGLGIRGIRSASNLPPDPSRAAISSSEQGLSGLRGI